MWKIRQAQRGKVTVGPVRRAASEGEPVEYKVLPLRFTATSVDQMDAIWRALGMRSRSDFVRTAIDAYVKSLASRPAAAAVSLELVDATEEEAARGMKVLKGLVG